MKNKSVLLGILIIVVVILLTGCSLFYNLVDKDEFKQHFGAVGYTVSDKVELDEKEVLNFEDAETYLVATKSDVPFKVQYFEFKNDTDAKIAIEEYSKNIRDYIYERTTNYKSEGAVNKQIVSEGTSDYNVITRVKNTIIFIKSTPEYKNEINDLLKAIEYLR